MAASALPALTVTVLPVQGGSVPAGAQRVTMVRLQLQASCAGSVALSTIRIHHQGLGDSADIDRVYLVADGARITRSLSINAKDQTALLQLRGWTLPACAAKTLDVDADYSPDASPASEHALTILAASDIAVQGNARVILNPVPGKNQPRPTSGNVSGGVSVESLPLLEPLYYGVHQTVATVRITATGTKDQLLTGITFTNDGSASDADLRNLYLESSDHRHLTAIIPQMQGRTVALTFSPPFLLSAHEKVVFNMVADIRASRRRTVNFLVEEPADVQAETCAGSLACLQAH